MFLEGLLVLHQQKGVLRQAQDERVARGEQ